MLQIGAFNAKNTFGNLLDRVENGEEVLITRHGKPVARLVRPAPEKVPEGKAPEVSETMAAFAEIRALSKRLNLGPFDWEKYKEWRDEGRR